MARLRNIKPAFFADEKLASDHTRDERLFYIALWTEADDEGRFRAHPRRVLGALFPYDEDLSAEQIETWMVRLAATGRLVLSEVDGERYGWLPKLAEHQSINRPTPSKLPPHGVLSESSVSAHVVVSASSCCFVGLSVCDTEDDLQPLKAARERDVAAQPVDRQPDAPSPTPAAQPDHDATARLAIRAANRGMSANTRLGGRYNPLPESHSDSTQAVHDWLAFGIPPPTILAVVYERAAAYRPNGYHKQISTLTYFDAAVREQHQRNETADRQPGETGDGRRSPAKRSGGGTGRPAGGGGARDAAAGTPGGDGRQPWGEYE